MKIYVLTSSDQDLVLESSAFENHESILESGVPFLSLEAAQEDALGWLKEMYADLCLEGEVAIEWELEEDPTGGMAGHKTWKACDERTGFSFQVREYEVTK